MKTQIPASHDLRAETPCLHAVPAAAVAVLDQCAAFLQQTGDAAYRAESRALVGGTIGRHVRHVLDHYRAILEPAPVAGGTGGAIDYDHRERNVPMETDRMAALQTIGRLRRKLTRIDNRDLSLRVRVCLMVAGDGTEAVLESTLGRELAFASHHAIHHQAMIRAIGAEHGAASAQDFGLAPSTINYRASLSTTR